MVEQDDWYARHPGECACRGRLVGTKDVPAQHGAFCQGFSPEMVPAMERIYAENEEAIERMWAW